MAFDSYESSVHLRIVIGVQVELRWSTDRLYYLLLSRHDPTLRRSAFPVQTVASSWMSICTAKVSHFDQEKKTDGFLVDEHECDVKYRSHVSDATKVNVLGDIACQGGLNVDGLCHNENEPATRRGWKKIR